MKRDNLEELLQKRGSFLFMAYMLLAVIPLLTYKTEFNAPFKFAFTYLSLPVLVGSFYVYLYKMPIFRSQTGTLKGSMLTVIFSALLILMSGGYISLANAWGPGQHGSVLDGQVVDLSISRGRSSKSYLVTVSSASGKNTKIEVSRAEYARLSVGQHYSQTWRVGSLGILYK